MCATVYQSSFRSVINLCNVKHLKLRDMILANSVTYNIFKKMRIKNRMSVMRIVRDEKELKNEQPEKTEA